MFDHAGIVVRGIVPRSIILAVVGLAFAAPLPAGAETRSGDSAGRSQPIAEAPNPRAPSLDAMVAEVLAAMEEQRVQIVALRREIEAARGSSHVLELQRRIEALKRDTEIRILRIQATHARAVGRREVAERLEQAILALSAPPARGVPMERPAPSADRAPSVKR
jgi:hypothetical protein